MVRVTQREEMTLRLRRPPEEYVSLLSKSEPEFQEFIEAFEKHPLFDRLMREGTIAKLRLRGRIPAARYEEFMDTQLLEFLRTSQILEHLDWERDLLSPHALSRVPELAQKYNVAPGTLLRHLRYLKSSSESNFSSSRASRLKNACSDRNHGEGHHGKRSSGELIEQTAAGDTRVDLTEIIETTREWVQRYNVSEQDFLDIVLGGEALPEALAGRFGCSLREAEEVLEAADRLYLAESYEAAGQGQAQSTLNGPRESEAPVAWVEVIGDKVAIQFHHDSVYTQRYHIKPHVLRAALAASPLKDSGSANNGLSGGMHHGGGVPSGDKSSNGPHGAASEAGLNAMPLNGAASSAAAEGRLPAEARELLARARLINQRLSALSRLITSLCNAQIEYLRSGDMRHLKPLAQAELARQMGEHPSTISRLIRGKCIETPWGKFPLLFLCQSKTDVVARLIGTFPKLTDLEVVSRLREEHDCNIARRTVAYHRGKRLRRNKRHKSTQNQNESTATNRPPATRNDGG
ncbi:MAG: polymerase sigma-54 factor [Abditibacteriota bacterium]|nr:polymerase sigma-54 factor [Abditibacteriota bacterium]